MSDGILDQGPVGLERCLYFALYLLCCDLTFRAQNTNLEHLYIIKVLMHAYATIMFKDSRCSL